MKYFTLLLIAMSLLLCVCSDDKTTNPPAQQGSILLSKLVVSMIPGGSEAVTISSADGNGAYSDCSVSNDGSGIASATISDSTLQITGISVGTANLTITNGVGKSCVLPVQVYDHRVLDAGDLLITYSDDFELIGHGWEHSKWRPIPPAGFFALGSMAMLDTFPPVGIAVMVVKAKPGTNAIAFTDSFQTSPWPGNGSCIPIPPPGYKAMGMIAVPPPDSAPCIREDLTIAGALDTLYVHSLYSIWAISQPYAGPHSGTYLAPGMYVEVGGTEAPTDHPAANVLKVDLPMITDAPDQEFVPKLNGYIEPPIYSAPMLGKAMLAPFSVITDMMSDDEWQLANSPTYRFEREVFYKRLFYNYNQTSEVQTNSVTLESGLTTERSETIRAQIGYSLGVELGITNGIVSGKVTGTYSIQFGYDRQTSVSELTAKSVTISINTPPGKAAALWQKYNRFTLYRHNGNSLEPVRSEEIGIDSYVTDEYPD